MTVVEKAFSRLSLSKESKSQKVLEKEKDVKDASSSDGEAPPTYTEQQQQPQLEDEQFVLEIPPLSFPDPGLATEKTVEKDRCILHLKLLASLADLRETISAIEGLFGISDDQALKFEKEPDRRNVLIRTREKRWAVYTARAVDRYAAWWTNCVPVSEASPTIYALQDKSYADLTNASPLTWLAKNLPPLDVLMVWHAHMLNPRNYLEDCIRGGKMSAWATDFPWHLVDAAIDNKSLDYNPGDEAVEHFTKNTGLQWENLDDSTEKELSCLNCSRPFKVAWTSGEFGTDLESPFERCSGYADKNFLAYCPSLNCGFKHDHQSLRVARFHQDAEDLLSKHRPMPGTYLSIQGTLEFIKVNDIMFPNHLIRASNGVISEVTRPKLSGQDMNDVKNTIEILMRDPKTLYTINGATRYALRLVKEQRISIRRMMSHYWENSSIFALDLVGAVIRQGTFIQKMDNLDWIHSPAVAATMDRLIRKYDIFFQIMISHANKMAVPTLDVDLAWHTHQMSPSRYFAYSLAKTSQVRLGLRTFIDHDDKVDEAQLSDSFQWTSKKYFEMTNGELYSECTCWYCEATRESFLYPTLSIPSSATKRARTLAESLHDDPRISSEPDKNPHISAHNAVRVTTATGVSDSRNADFKAMRLRQMWNKAHRRHIKRQQKQGRNGSKSANQNNNNNNQAVDPYYPMIYGYPLFMPYYAPYMADPWIYSGAYACNPSCMSVVAGSYGNCAAGTCGASVASGACAGVGGGGCGGGGAAACGGGGGGGGCGGGGGGGGGCGGGGGG